MKRFKSVGQAQRFLAAFGAISPHFRPRRHRLSAPEYRQVMAGRFAAGGGTRSPGPHRLRSRPESVNHATAFGLIRARTACAAATSR